MAGITGGKIIPRSSSRLHIFLLHGFSSSFAEQMPLYGSDYYTHKSFKSDTSFGC